MAKKKLSSKSNYVPNRMINEIEVERNGKTTYIDGANVLDGMYVKKGVKYGNGGGVAVSSENGGYTVGTNADFSINHPSSDVDYSMYAKGGGIGKTYAELYNKIVLAVMKDIKVSREKAEDIVNENEGWLTDMIEYEGETNVTFLADQITTTDEGLYAKGGGVGKNSIKDNRMNERTRAVILKIQKTRIHPDDVSPNFVNDVANENGINLSSEEVVFISDNYGTKFANGGGVGVIKGSTLEKIYKTGFVSGDIVNDEQRNPLRYLFVTNKGKVFIVGDNGERREWIEKNGEVKTGKLVKGDLSLSDLKKQDKYANGGSLKSKAKYVPNYMVQSVEVERKGKTTDIDGADIYDGFYVKKGVKFAKGGNLKTKNGVSYKVIEFNSPMGKYKYVINGLKIGGYNFSYVSDKKLSDAEIERVASENKFANGGSVWGGTAESSQDGMLIGGTNAELTSNQYGSGGKITSADEGTGSSDLREKAQAKIDKGMTVIDFSYTDYGGSFGDKVAIAYFKKHHPKNILVENSAYNGQNAFVFGKVADEYLEAIEDYPLGFEDMEEFYYDMQNQVEEKEFKSFVKELKSDGYKVSPNTLNWLMENKSGYYRLEPNMLDYSPESLTEELIEEGLVSKKMEDGGMLGSWSYSIGGL